MDKNAQLARLNEAMSVGKFHNRGTDCFVNTIVNVVANSPLRDAIACLPEVQDKPVAGRLQSIFNNLSLIHI